MTPRNASRQLRAALVSTLTLLSVSACAAERTPNGRLIVALVDYSESEPPAALRHFAQTLTDDVLPRLGSSDRLVVLPLDASSATAPVRIVDLDLRERSFSQPHDGIAHAESRRAARRQSLMDSLRAPMRDRIVAFRADDPTRARHTDIIGSLDAVARLIAAHPPRATQTPLASLLPIAPADARDAIVIIFSDMRQDTPSLSFEHRPSLSQAHTESLLDSLRRHEGLPDLSRARIVITGSTAADRASWQRVRNFWVRYLKASHAELGAYDFDATASIREVLR